MDQRFFGCMYTRKQWNSYAPSRPLLFVTYKVQPSASQRPNPTLLARIFLTTANTTRPTASCLRAAIARSQPHYQKVQIERTPQHSWKGPYLAGCRPPSQLYRLTPQEREISRPSPPCQSLRIPRAGRISRQYLGVNCQYHGCNTVARSKYWLVPVAHGPYRKLRG